MVNRYQKLQKLYKGYFKGLEGRGGAQEEIVKRYNYFKETAGGIQKLDTILKLQDVNEKRNLIEKITSGDTVMEVEQVIPEQIETKEYTIEDSDNEDKLFDILSGIENYDDFTDSVITEFINKQSRDDIKKLIKNLTVKDINRIFRQLKKIEKDLDKKEEEDYYETKEFKDAVEKGISIDLPDTEFVETSGEKQVDLVPTPIEPTESKVSVSENSIKLKPTNLGENNIDYEIKIGDKTQKREPEEVFGKEIRNIPDAITAKAPTKRVKITTKTKGKTIKEFRTGKKATGEVRPPIKIANVQDGANMEQQLDMLDDMEKPIGKKYIKSATRPAPKSNITAKPTIPTRPAPRRTAGRKATGNIRPPITINKIDDTTYVDDYVLPEPQKRITTKKTPAKKTTAKKATAKKTTAKKATAKKTTAKKATVSKMKAPAKKMKWADAVSFYYKKYNPDCYYPKKGTKHHAEVMKLMGK